MKTIYKIAKYNTENEFLKILDDEIGVQTTNRIQKIITMARARKIVGGIAPKYITKVSRHFKVQRSKILDKCRERHISYIRSGIVLALKDKYPEANLADISKHVGQPHHFISTAQLVYEKNHIYKDYKEIHDKCKELLNGDNAT